MNIVLEGKRLVESGWLPNGPTEEQQKAIDAYYTALGASRSNWFPNGKTRAIREFIALLNEPVKFGGGG